MKRNAGKIVLGITGMLVVMIVAWIGFHYENIEIVGHSSDLILYEKPLVLVEIKGMQNKAIQQKLNENIRNDMEIYLEDYFKDPGFIRTDGFYSEVVGEKYLYISYAIKFGGNSYYSYYNVVYDLKTGERVCLDDLFILNEGFVTAVKRYGKDYDYDRGESIITYLGYENDSEEYIIEILEKIAMEPSEWNRIAEEKGTKSYYKPDFLITEENLYLPVPIPLDKLEDYLKVPKWW